MILVSSWQSSRSDHAQEIAFFEGFLAANRALKGKQVTEQSGICPVQRVSTEQMDKWAAQKDLLACSC